VSYLPFPGTSASRRPGTAPTAHSRAGRCTPWARSVPARMDDWPASLAKLVEGEPQPERALGPHRDLREDREGGGRVIALGVVQAVHGRDERTGRAACRPVLPAEDQDQSSRVRVRPTSRYDMSTSTSARTRLATTKKRKGLRRTSAGAVSVTTCTMTGGSTGRRSA
jgi:hypothetical protein